MLTLLALTSIAMSVAADDSARVLTIDLGCASHNAMWEKNRTLLFKASLDWLRSGSVNGAKEGIVRLGY